MSRLTTALLLSSSVLLATFAPNSVQAESWRGYENSNHQYELFVDHRGRRFLVDIRTGEIVGRANPRARFTRRDKIRAQRALRRSESFDYFDRDEDRFFDDDPFFDTEDRRFQRQRNRHKRVYKRGRFLDEFGIDEGYVGSTRRYEEPDRPQYQSEPEARDQQVARLPQSQQPVVRRPAVEGVNKPKFNSTQIAALQIVLDREGFSPGVVDGIWGSNLARALAARSKSRPDASDLDNASALDQQIKKTGGEIFSAYTITRADVAGPFVAAVPIDYAKKSRLAALSYTSAAEMLAERFHMSEAFLRKLNPGKRFDHAGTRIKVVAPGGKISSKVHYIVADKGQKQVRAFDRNGKLVASYPATIGSASTPSPSGTHSIERIALNPEYTYNPKKNFQQGSNDKILTIAPGPNGPVGSVWIALSKPSYGIHGTPNPRTIGKTSSHGCIRLTNWDAQELASVVREGVTVQFVE
ncbi:MAG: L,D-transpeptidase family protein [Rhizobiaceae bacterium]|nr:L,D-transpeptidase family protein [Rhizobiaceae bacterium]